MVLKSVTKVWWITLSSDQTYASLFAFFLLSFSCLSPNPCYLQLPADLTKMHLTDNPHPQVTHVPSSQSGCSIASDSGSSSLSDIYQVKLHLFLIFPSLMLSIPQTKPGAVSPRRALVMLLRIPVLLVWAATFHGHVEMKQTWCF